MKNNYSFLRDTLAIQEIRKHKWIESEKQGEEMGFATAAVDWVKKYGHQWNQFRATRQESQDPFSEKRQYRRFQRRFPLQIKLQNQDIECQTDNINLLGLACTIPHPIDSDTEALVTLQLPQDTQSKNPHNRLRFQTHIARVSEKDTPNNTRNFNVFLPFSEEIKNFIRRHSDILNN